MSNNNNNNNNTISNNHGVYGSLSKEWSEGMGWREVVDVVEIEEVWGLNLYGQFKLNIMDDISQEALVAWLPSLLSVEDLVLCDNDTVSLPYYTIILEGVASKVTNKGAWIRPCKFRIISVIKHNRLG